MRAVADAAQDLHERGHVEDVAQALAVGLEQDGEAGVARGDGEQVVGALALLPERRAAVGAAAREQQGAARRSRGTWRRRARWSRAGAGRARRPPRARAAAGRRRAARRPPGSGGRSRLRSTWSRRRGRRWRGCCAVAAMAQGAWIAAAEGREEQTRQSPSSSRTRSMTMVRSSGTCSVASSWSAR